MIEYILLILLLGLLIGWGVPIAWSLLISGSAGVISVLGFDRSISIFVTTAHGTVSAYLFTTIPMFLLMAFFLSESEIIEDIFNAVYIWTSHIRGGLAMATTLANGGIAALSGSSTASAATMARISVPEMQKYGYDDRLSMGTVSSAGTFAIMIPPSIGLILYGILTNTGIARLFIAGIIPGILTIGSYLMVIYFWGKVNPEAVGGVGNRHSWSEKIDSLRPLLPSLLLIVIVLGGLYGGFMTPSEAGAVGASGALAVGVLFAGLRTRGVSKSMSDTLEVTAMIFMIMVGAMVFSRFLTVTGMTSVLVSAVGNLPIDRWFILSLILLVYLILGMFMNQSSILILTLPLTYPLVVTGLGFDPIWFGILLVKVGEVGMVTPPLGLNVYVASGAVDIDVETTFKGAFRFILADIVVLIILMAIPATVLWLPGTMA